MFLPLYFTPMETSLNRNAGALYEYTLKEKRLTCEWGSWLRAEHQKQTLQLRDACLCLSTDLSKHIWQRI